VNRTGQLGFSLLEVLIAVSLTIGVLLATSAAVANSLRGSALAEHRITLDDDALSVLNDARAISAYDPAMFKALSGRTATMTRSGLGGASETISITVTRLAGSSNLAATATVSEGTLSISERQTLFLEAPAPGSSVSQ